MYLILCIPFIHTYISCIQIIYNYIEEIFDNYPFRGSKIYVSIICI